MRAGPLWLWSLRTPLALLVPLLTVAVVAQPLTSARDPFAFAHVTVIDNDIRHSTRIAGVVANDVLYDKTALRTMLADAEAGRRPGAAR